MANSPVRRTSNGHGWRGWPIISRRPTFVALAGVLAGCAVLAACSGGGLTPNPTPPENEAQAAKAAGGAVDMFLKVDGAPGESADKAHKNEIPLATFGFNVTQSGAGAPAGGAGAGKAAFEDLTVVMETNKASPKLFLWTANGQHVKEATLSVRKAGGRAGDFLTVKITDVLVSGYEILGGEDRSSNAPSRTTSSANPVERVKLNYAKIEMTYKQTKADGSLGTPVNTGYDLQKNAKV